MKLKDRLILLYELQKDLTAGILNLGEYQAAVDFVTGRNPFIKYLTEERFYE